MASAKEIYARNRSEWRAWLEENHNAATEIWLTYYKKHTGTASISYVDAVEEALCFGWIDSIVRRIDEELYAQKFSPRKKNSSWSKLNKQRANKLIRQGRMTAEGLAKVEEAKISGKWHDSFDRAKSGEMRPEFESALAANDKASYNFAGLAPSYRKRYIDWIARAKKDETRQNRVEEAIALLARGQKLGMK